MNLLLLLLFCLSLIVVKAQDGSYKGEDGTDLEYAFCGDCFCIHGNETCPAGDLAPQTSFSPALVAFLKSLTVTNPYSLSCNPYGNETCQTTPPQTLIELGDDAVCAIKYANTTGQEEEEECPTEYTLETYASMEEASQDGAYITHWGACGVCSTAQDLAVYIEYIDLVSKGTECSLRGLSNTADGIGCFMEVGYTEPCARMWLYNAANTGQDCLEVCTEFRMQQKPNNGPPNECALADCLQCDEDFSGPNFAKYAARTRRRSGLLSKIVRPCDAILLVNHSNVPCNISSFVTNVPSSSSTPAPLPNSGGGCIADTVGDFTKCVATNCPDITDSCGVAPNAYTCDDVEAICQSIPCDCCPPCESELDALWTCITSDNCDFGCFADGDCSPIPIKDSAETIGLLATMTAVVGSILVNLVF